MIIKLLKPNTVVSALISFGLLILFWAKSFNTSQASNFLNVGVLYHFENEITSAPYWLLISSSILLIIVTAVILNTTINQDEFFDKNTLLPFTLYLLLMSVLVSFNKLNPIIIANLFLVLFLRWSFKIRRQEDARRIIFNASFLLSCATLFFPYYAPFLLSPFALLLSFRPFVWREWFLTGLSLFIPAGFYAYLMYFLDFPFENNTYNHSFWEIFNLLYTAETHHYLYIVLYVLLSISAFFVIYKRMSFGSLRLRMLLRFLGYNSIVALILSLSLYLISDVFLIVAALPLSIIFSYYFYHAKPFFSNLNLYLLIGLIVYSIFFV